MTIHTDDDVLDELEQRAAAERILLNILRVTLGCPGALDSKGVALMISAAATERERHGDYVAANLLCQWKAVVDGWN